MDHPCDNRDKNLVALMDGRMNGEESSSKKVDMRSKYTWDHQDDNILLGLGSMIWAQDAEEHLVKLVPQVEERDGWMAG